MPNIPEIIQILLKLVPNGPIDKQLLELVPSSNHW